MNAVDILKNDHKKLLKIMENLEQAADNESENCDELFQQFKEVFKQHDQAEDDIFYPELKQYSELKKLVSKGYQAHHIVEATILELRIIPYASDLWAPKFSLVRDSILSHMTEEEGILFPEVEKLLDKKKLDEMGKEIKKQRE